MGASVLVAFATKRGSTREVAESIALVLRERGLQVELEPVAEVAHLSCYDGVVLGTALYVGRLHRDAGQFLKRFRRELSGLPLAVFAMGPRTLEDADVQGSRAQLERELARVPEVEPASVAIFGGVVDPARLHFPLNRMPASDARDWAAIRAWAEEVSQRLEHAAVLVPS